MKTAIFIILGIALAWILLEGISAIKHVKDMPDNYEENNDYEKEVERLSKEN